MIDGFILSRYTSRMVHQVPAVGRLVSWLVGCLLRCWFVALFLLCVSAFLVGQRKFQSPARTALP